MSISVFNIPVPLSDSFLLFLRICGFGVVPASFLRRFVSVPTMLAAIAALLVFSLPIFLIDSPSLVELFELRTAPTVRLGAITLLAHLSYGLLLGIVATSVISVMALVAHWTNNLFFPAGSWGGPHQSGSVESALMILAIAISLPFASQAFEFFLDSFLQLPLHTRELALSTTAWRIVLAVGQMTFSLTLLILLPTFVVYLIGFVSLAVMDRLFPGLVSSHLSRALLLPFLLLAFAYGVNRLALFQAESTGQVLQFKQQQSIIEASPVER